MKIDYPSIAVNAGSALGDAGQPVTLHKRGEAEYVPGVGVTPSIADYQGVGAVFGYLQDHIDGSAILQGDQRLLLAPQIAAKPVTGDTITANGVTYSIVSVQEAAPAGVPVLYKLQIRGV